VGVGAGIAFWVLGRAGPQRARRSGSDGERTSTDD
jgi:hypothetical protein